MQILSKTKKAEVAVDATGAVYVNSKPVSINDALKEYAEAEASGGALLSFPSAQRIKTIEEGVAAQREKIDAEITKVETAIENANKRYFVERDEWEAERQRIEALEAEVRAFKNRRPPMTMDFDEQRRLKQLQDERQAVLSGLSEATSLRNQDKLSAEELAQISNEAALLGRIRKAI